MSGTVPAMKGLVTTIGCIMRHSQLMSSNQPVFCAVQRTFTHTSPAFLPRQLHASAAPQISASFFSRCVSDIGLGRVATATHRCYTVSSFQRSNFWAPSGIEPQRKHCGNTGLGLSFNDHSACSGNGNLAKFSRGYSSVSGGAGRLLSSLRLASTNTGTSSSTGRSRVPEPGKIASSIGSLPKDVQVLSTKRVVRRKKTKGIRNRDQEYLDVTAYTSADEYNLETLRAELKQSDRFSLQHLPEDAFDALHLLMRCQGSADDAETRDVFLFREGSIVFWNVPEPEQHALLRLLSPHQLGAYESAALKEEGVESLEFTHTDGRTSLVSGAVHLHRAQDDLEASARQLELFTFSNAIALSVKLSVWEASLSAYVDSVEWVLQDLKEGKKIRMSEADVLRKAGELFTLSHLVNLSSDLLDTPDFYWDRNQLEILYQKTCNYLSIARRVKVMNEKLRQCVELTELLRDHLKDEHHTRLELMIIFLIFIEVVFSTFHLVEMYWNKPRIDTSIKSD